LKKCKRKGGAEKYRRDSAEPRHPETHSDCGSVSKGPAATKKKKKGGNKRRRAKKHGRESPRIAPATVYRTEKKAARRAKENTIV